MTKPLAMLMEKEVSRKEFLAIVGFGIISILGFSNIVRLLTGKPLGHYFGQKVSYGYGSGAYGGGKETAKLK